MAVFTWFHCLSHVFSGGNTDPLIACEKAETPPTTRCSKFEVFLSILVADGDAFTLTQFELYITLPGYISLLMLRSVRIFSG